MGQHVSAHVTKYCQRILDVFTVKDCSVWIWCVSFSRSPLVLISLTYSQASNFRFSRETFRNGPKISSRGKKIKLHWFRGETKKDRENHLFSGPHLSWASYTTVSPCFSLWHPRNMAHLKKEIIGESCGYIPYHPCKVYLSTSGSFFTVNVVM